VFHESRLPIEPRKSYDTKEDTASVVVGFLLFVFVVLGYGVPWLYRALGAGSTELSTRQKVGFAAVLLVGGVLMGAVKHYRPLAFAVGEVGAGVFVIASALAERLVQQGRLANMATLLAASYALAKGTEGVLKHWPRKPGGTSLPVATTQGSGTQATATQARATR
jgi:hypothetical protein